MSIIDKIKGMVNPDNVDDNYDSDDEYIFDGDNGEYGYGDQQEPMNGFAPQPQMQQPQMQQPMPRNQGGSGIALNSNSLELKVVRPETYDSATAQKIADHLLNHRTVVLNLEIANKEASRRLIDFLSGVAYSIDGYIQRVANNTFVIVPNNVDVSGEQIKEQQFEQPQQQTNRNTGSEDLFN